MAKFRTHFELDIQDIDFIEVSLTRRVGDLTRRVMNARQSDSEEGTSSAARRVSTRPESFSGGGMLVHFAK